MSSGLFLHNEDGSLLIWPKAMAFADNQKTHIRERLKQRRQIILSDFPFSSFLPVLRRNELRKNEICLLLLSPAYSATFCSELWSGLPLEVKHFRRG
jgi:hypothetical protein